MSDPISSSEEREETQELVRAARHTRRNAVAPYSKFLVGAALQDSTGEIWRGCNVESSSFGLSMCAERVALFNALAAGARGFGHMAVVASAPEGVVTPCGACRQVLHDHAPSLKLTLFNPETGETWEGTIQELLPLPFRDSVLPGEGGR